MITIPNELLNELNAWRYILVGMSTQMHDHGDSFSALKLQNMSNRMREYIEQFSSAEGGNCCDCGRQEHDS